MICYISYIGHTCSGNQCIIAQDFHTSLNRNTVFLSVHIKCDLKKEMTGQNLNHMGNSWKTQILAPPRTSAYENFKFQAS